MQNLEELYKIYPLYQGKVGNQFKSLAGKHIGMTTFLYRTNDRIKGKPQYVCECDCGKIFLISKSFSDCFHNGKEKNINCGDHYNQDFSGQRFNNFLVLSKVPKEERPIGQQNRLYFNCKCDCGNIFILPTSKLKTTQCCPICSKNIKRLNAIIDLTGKQYGNLTVINRVETNEYKARTKWLCQCKCGKTTIVEGRHLQDGSTTSCGCISYSFNEYKIATLLDELNIPYETEYKFLELGKLRFDFFVNNQYIIEYDGEQHFLLNRRGDLTATHEHDMLKNNFCFNNNIPIIRIPFTKRTTYTKEDLLLDTTRFLLTHDNIKEYYNQIEISSL